MKPIANKLVAIVAAAAFTALATTALAAELPEGSVISKENIDKVKGDTFEGKTIGSMLTEKTELMIRNYGLRLNLVHSKPVVVDPRFAEYTKKYSGQVKFDPANREIKDWTAGLPFPSIDEKDPNAASKLLWNFYMATSVEGGDLKNTVAYMYIDGKKGLDKVNELIYSRYYMKGRLDTDNPTVGDGEILNKTLIAFTYPYDARGLTVLTIHYNEAKFDDSWIYVKSMRRTRRLSGNNLLDSIGGADILQDDVNIWNARPSWYPKIKLLGKRWIFAMAHAKKPIRDLSKKGTPDEFPMIDLKNAPYWNPVNVWEPREVYVIEATAPAEHVYGKKVMYMDADLNANMIWASEIYDKKDEFWKFIHFACTPEAGKLSGRKYRKPSAHVQIDFKAMHATSPYIHEWVLDSGMKPADVSLEQLEATAK